MIKSFQEWMLNEALYKGDDVKYCIRFTNYGLACLRNDDSLIFIVDKRRDNPSWVDRTDKGSEQYDFNKGKVLCTISKEGKFQRGDEDAVVVIENRWSSKNRKEIPVKVTEDFFWRWMISRKNEKKLGPLVKLPAFSNWAHQFRGANLGHELGFA